MLSLIRNSSTKLRDIASLPFGHQDAELHGAVADAGAQPRFDEIYASSTRKSDKEVLANVLAQL